MSEARPVPGFPGYFVTREGEVFRTETRRVAAHVSEEGYRRAWVISGGVRARQYVHRLVALAFHGVPPEGSVARHLDGSRDNNTPENVVWGSHAENSADTVRHGRTRTAHGPRHYRATLSTADVVGIRDARGAGETLDSVAARFNTSASNVSMIANGKTRREG